MSFEFQSLGDEVKTWMAVQPMFLAFWTALRSPPEVGMCAPMRVAGMVWRVPVVSRDFVLRSLALLGMTMLGVEWLAALWCLDPSLCSG